jgi:hypothetical protein
MNDLEPDGYVPFQGDSGRQRLTRLRKTGTEERYVFISDGAVADEPLLGWARNVPAIRVGSGFMVPLVPWQERFTAEGQPRHA